MFSFRNTYLLGLVLVAAGVSSCEPEIKQNTSGKPFFSGKANVTRFVAVGGDFLSGMTDNEQFISGQEASVANIVAAQFRKVGGGVFEQPLMFDELGLGNRKKLARIMDCRNEDDLAAIPYGGVEDPRNESNIGTQGPFANFSVPYARAVDLNSNSYASANKYFGRFATRTSASILDDVQLVNPTFFILWAGDRDVYGYAINGGAAGLGTPNITSAANFRTAMETTIQKLISRGAKGVLVNIPEINSLPFFTTIPYDAITLTQDEADRLNIIYATNPNLAFKEGKNPFVVNEGGLFARFAEPNEYIKITLNQDSVKCKGYGTLTPLSDSDILAEDEIDAVNTAIRRFNNIIQELADKYGLAVFSADELFHSVSTTGVNFDGINYTDDYVTGGFISLDGIHPTKRGNAIIANELIKFINDFYSAKIPLPDINVYPTVEIP